ncbi:MAG: ABC transporter permease [Ignavibacteriales bacterium]|nr:ABC transporter permease [Ignavibacteriales bacterium]
MKIPLKYTVRNFKTRLLTTGITVAGITLVVFVFAAVLMMAHGIDKTLVATGSPDNVIIARKAATGEISSIVVNSDAAILFTLPHIAKTSDGRPLATSDVVVIINLEKTSGGLSNLTVRGVSPQAFTIRPQVKIVEGRIFRQGAREIVVGDAVARRYTGTKVGGQISFGGDKWTIVGRFEAGGSGFDSEVWGDSEQLQDAFNRRGGYSTVTLRLDDPKAYSEFKAAFDREQRLQQFEPKSEQQYYAEQSEAMSLFIRILGIFITVIFSAGATIGAMITMYAAVANRTVEIGTLRALGFRRRSILTAFLMESMLLSIIGGLIGIACASVLQFFSISTLNFGSFSELEFSFAMSPGIVVASLLFAAGMGFIGGFLPSVQASRLNIVNALRAG